MKFSVASRIRLATLALALGAGTAAHAQQPPPVPAAIATLARAVAAELVMHCPLADADDTAAFESCRAALEGGSLLRGALPERVLWGREAAAQGLAQAPLTQLAPETWTHLYAPLFMFNGNHQVEWVAAENQFVIRLEAAFRNRLAPGQFPYPFWHEPAKWSAYQQANGLLLWVQPQTARIHVAQFTDGAPTALLQEVRPVARQFDGLWLWTDAGGRTQPAVTLFDGLYRPENPYRGALDRHYRDLALQLREAQCSSCHVPSNPGQSRRLVLLSSPAHVAGEIDRVIRAVRDERPAGARHALGAEDRQWLLKSAEAFRDTVSSAREWEREAARREGTRAWRPAQRDATMGAAGLPPQP